MNAQNFISGIQGCAQGYFFSIQALGRESFTGAGNSYNTILPRYMLMTELVVMGLQINAAVPYPSQTLVNKTLHYMPRIGVAMAAAVALVREGDYPGPSLPPLARKACCFLAENWGEMSLVAMGAAAVGFAVLGNPAYGASILAALTYNVLDKRGYVDERISKFIVLFMPALSCSMVIATSGVSFISFGAAMQLANILLPASEDTTLPYRIDNLFRRVFGVQDIPSLEELEGPLLLKKNWTQQNIEEILNRTSSDFELDPAHLSKPLQAYAVNLPQDRAFSKKIPALFNDLIWDSDLVLTALKQNNRFLNFMTQKLPDVDRRDMKQMPVAVVSAEGQLQENFDRYQKLRACIAQVAQQTKPNMTTEEFIDDWIRTRITKIAARVEEDLPTDAPPHIVAAKTRCAQLFRCILLLSKEEQTKGLVTLALGAESASWEQIEDVVTNLLELLLENDETRNAIIQHPFHKAMVTSINKYKQIRYEEVKKTGQAKVPGFTVGLYPMSPPMRRSVTLLPSIAGLGIGRLIRQDIYLDYQQEIFTPRNLNKHWSEEEITSWLMLLLPNPAEHGPLVAKSLKVENRAAFRNLLLYRLGILRLKS